MKEMSVKSRGKKTGTFPSLCREKTETFPFPAQGKKREISLFRSEGKTENFRFFPKGRKNYIYKYI